MARIMKAAKAKGLFGGNQTTWCGVGPIVSRARREGDGPLSGTGRSVRPEGALAVSCRRTADGRSSHRVSPAMVESRGASPRGGELLWREARADDLRGLVWFSRCRWPRRYSLGCARYG